MLAKSTANIGARFNIGSTVCVWHEKPEQFARSFKFCDHIATRTICHKGWFLSDLFQDETARGVVFAISHGRFMAGIADPYQFDGKAMSGPCVVCVDEVFDSELDAALRADSLAECYAEDAREDDAKFRAEQDAEDAAREAAERAEWESRDVVTV